MKILKGDHMSSEHGEKVLELSPIPYIAVKDASKYFWEVYKIPPTAKTDIVLFVCLFFLFFLHLKNYTNNVRFQEKGRNDQELYQYLLFLQKE